MPTDYVAATNGQQYTPGLLKGPGDKYALVFDNSGNLKIVANPFGSSPVEVLKCDTNGNLVSLASGSTVSLGTGTGTAKFGARIYSAMNGVTGFQPSLTAAAKIVDQFTLPANSLAAGNIVYFILQATHAANANTVTVAVNLGGTGAVGATVTGGTNIVSFALATSGGVSIIAGYLLVQVAATNQTTFSEATTNATAATNTNVASTADLTASQLVNLTMNAATTATDATVVSWAASLLN